MADVGIRDYLKGRGYKDDEITYNNGNVMLKGKQFYNATPQADGSTYGDPDKLNQAYNKFSVGNNLDKVQQQLNTPREQFSYNAQSDPLYQNALGVAQRSAQTAGNNATVRLGARGIGNSQQALTTENQIQQRAVADVNSNLLPQYMQQAYNQYKDRYAMDQDLMKNQLGLGKAYNDQYLQGKDEEQQMFNNNRLIKSDNLNAARNVGNDLGRVLAPKDDWSNLYNQDDAPLNMDGQKYKDDLAQRAIDNQYKTAAQAIQQQNANRLSAGGGSKSGTSGAGGVKNISSAQFNDIADTLQKKYGVAKYKEVGKDDNDNPIYDENSVSYVPTNNPDQKVKIVSEILNAGLSDDDTLKLLNKMGITEAEARELLGG